MRAWICVTCYAIGGVFLTLAELVRGSRTLGEVFKKRNPDIVTSGMVRRRD